MFKADQKIQPSIVLIALLLVFLAVLVLIWRWYDLKNSQLEETRPHKLVLLTQVNTGIPN